MDLQVFSSGSDHNGYLLTNGKETLIIEAGINLSSVKKAVDFKTNLIVGCLVSHSHNDHAEHVAAYLKAGILVMASEQTFEEKNITKYRNLAKVVIPGKGYKVGRFKIIPFEAHHDVTCLGYHISHPETGNIMFLTDSFMTEYAFEKLSHILIEANYSDEILERNIISGKVHPAMRPRLLKTHMEINTTRLTILANNLTSLRNIVLLHLSNGNSNEEEFIRTIRTATGIPNVFAATKGMKINIDKEPF